MGRIFNRNISQEVILGKVYSVILQFVCTLLDFFL